MYGPSKGKDGADSIIGTLKNIMQKKKAARNRTVLKFYVRKKAAV